MTARPLQSTREAKGRATAILTGPAVAVRLSDPTAMLLRLVASHDGLPVAQAIDRLVCARAEAIGVPALLSVSPGENSPLANAGLRPNGADARSRSRALPEIRAAADTASSNPKDRGRP
jgi:hypothetical protein